MWQIARGRGNHSSRHLQNCLGSWNLVNKRANEEGVVWNGWQGPNYERSCGLWGGFGLISTNAVLRAWVLGHEEENQFQESS